MKQNFFYIKNKSIYIYVNVGVGEKVMKYAKI